MRDFSFSKKKWKLNNLKIKKLLNASIKKY